jgi:hypothetical protein
MPDWLKTSLRAMYSNSSGRFRKRRKEKRREEKRARAELGKKQSLILCFFSL